MASIPFEFECCKEGGFIPDPNEHKSVGYVTALNGLGGGKLKADLKVMLPFTSGITFPPIRNANSSQVSVVGVIEKFSWAGGVGNPIEIDFYVSQESATSIKSAQQLTLSSTKVSALGWWICDYDQEIKKWYEKSFPLGAGTITGTVANKDNPSLNVDMQGEPVKDGIDVMVYKVSIHVAPAANQSYTIRFANSATMAATKSWGLVVGSVASTAFKTT